MLPGAKAPGAASEPTQLFCLGLSISYFSTVKANEVWQFFFFFFFASQMLQPQTNKTVPTTIKGGKT